jgi:flagellar protein FliS
MLNRDAIKAYQTVEQDYMVEGADPHTLVQILFSEFIVNIELTIQALEVSDLAAKSAHITKCMMICHLLASSLDFDKGGDIAVPVYDRAARRRTGEKALSVRPGAVVICEGAPALALKAPGALRLAMTTDEPSRRTRFDAFYRWRGESDRAEAYWRQREVDEAPLLEVLNQSARILGQTREPLP